MKIILPMNIKAYELDDLNHTARQKALEGQVNFWLETREYKNKHKGNYERAVDKSEEMKTPWFVGSYVLEYCEKELVREIKANKYLYDEEGEFIPVKYYTRDGKIVKTVLRLPNGTETDIEIKGIKRGN